MQEPDRCHYHTGGRRCPEKATHVLKRRYFKAKWEEPLCDEHAKPKWHPPDIVKNIHRVKAHQ